MHCRVALRTGGCHRVEVGGLVGDLVDDEFDGLTALLLDRLQFRVNQTLVVDDRALNRIGCRRERDFEIAEALLFLGLVGHLEVLGSHGVRCLDKVLVGVRRLVALEVDPPEAEHRFEHLSLSFKINYCKLYPINILEKVIKPCNS